jgi:TolB-like protein/DNA-binding winged helix-turn-helix (wHTH) protein
MPVPASSSRVVRTGLFEINTGSGDFRKEGRRVPLQEQPFRVLATLLERPGEVITREELRAKIWPTHTFVAFDEGINTAIRKLRVAFGDSADNPRFIETLPRRGYRFIAPVAPATSSEAPVATVDPTSEVVLVTSALKPAGAPPARSSWHRRSLIVVAGLAMAFVMVLEFRNRMGRAELVPGAIQSIAVLPLQNLSGDAAQEYFADGITDEITTKLAKLSGVRVISRTSAMHFKATQRTVPEIARELNVGAIVEGSVERSADRVRVRVQLIQASTDRHLWAEEYDRQLSDVLRLEADMAQDIARQIQLRLPDRQRNSPQANRRLNPQVLQDYLLGRHYWSLRTPETLGKAVEYFNRAIQEDPNDGRSYAGLAQCYIVLPFYTGTLPYEAYQKARKAAANALALDDSLPEAHLAIAEVNLYQDWDFAGAEKEFRTTLALNPNDSTAHQWYGEFLTMMGRYPEAIQENETALALDPLSAIVHHQAAGTFIAAGQDDKSMEQFREVEKLNPNFLSVYESRSWLFRIEGKFLESIEDLQKSAPLWGPDYERFLAEVNKLKPAYAATGRAGYFRECLKVHQFYMRSHFYLARDYVELGDREAALAQLEQAYRNHDYEALWLLQDREVRSLRSEPRFQNLIRAVGLPQ